LVPQRFIYNDFKLGQFVNIQRTYQAKLTPDRKARLDGLGFVWNAR